ITYSTTKSAIYPVGTTATLVCDEGYLGGGQSAVLCVKSGWYPASGLGYCVRQNVTQLNSGTALAVSSASLVCAALGPVQNGQLIYSGIAVGGRFPKGTRASVLCNLGYEPFGPTDSICEGGKWSRKVATCESTTDPKCPSLKPPSGGRVMYSSIAPYGPSTTATLSCDLGLSVSGASLLQCTEEGWSPKAFGECKQLSAETIERAADFVACEALTCDFNHNHSCFYKLSGFGSTAPWQIGTSFIGNRHTGVQRLNQEDSDRVGFAYVGRDHVDDSNEVFVMESPKFTISTDARLLFDVYLRSHSPRLKVSSIVRDPD
ncbi:sushi domain protein, partial [Ancylostoma duodenale]